MQNEFLKGYSCLKTDYSNIYWQKHKDEPEFIAKTIAKYVEKAKVKLGLRIVPIDVYILYNKDDYLASHFEKGKLVKNENGKLKVVAFELAEEIGIEYEIDHVENEIKEFVNFTVLETINHNLPLWIYFGLVEYLSDSDLHDKIRRLKGISDKKSDILTIKELYNIKIWENSNKATKELAYLESAIFVHILIEEENQETFLHFLSKMKYMWNFEEFRTIFQAFFGYPVESLEYRLFKSLNSEFNKPKIIKL